MLAMVLMLKIPFNSEEAYRLAGGHFPSMFGGRGWDPHIQQVPTHWGRHLLRGISIVIAFLVFDLFGQDHHDL